MSEYGDRAEKSTGIEKIDLMILIDDIWEGVRRFGWLAVLLAVVFGAASYLKVSSSYVSSYVAEATVSVTAVGSVGSANGGVSRQDSATAEQMGKVFPYILTSNALQNVVAEKMGRSSVPGSISVSALAGTNLLTIRVTSGNGQDAYDVLQAVIEYYPEVAQYVVGQTTLEVLDDGGVPVDTGKNYTVRGSMKKGALTGALIGVMIIGIYLLTRRTVKSPTELKKIINIPCLGVLPVYKKKKRRKGSQTMNILGKGVQQDYLEAMRAVRTRVEREMERSEARTLLVTSSVPGEGKSSVASNLAIAMAKRGKRVILVDCDLRNPSIKSTFGIKGGYLGLKDVLTDEATVREALIKVRIKNKEDFSLQLMPGSECVSHNTEILAGKKMEELIENLKSMADVVILDSAPTALLVDVSMLTRVSDLALYIIRYDDTRQRDILDGIQVLNDSGIKIAGCVINRAKKSVSGNGHYGGSYYYRASEKYGRGYSEKS